MLSCTDADRFELALIFPVSDSIRMTSEKMRNLSDSEELRHFFDWFYLIFWHNIPLTNIDIYYIQNIIESKY